MTRFFENDVFILFLVSLLAVFVFGQVIAFGVVNLDDDRIIFEHYYFHQREGSIFDAFRHGVLYPTTSSSYYRPLMTLSFIWDANIGGITLWFYHLTTLLLHVIASIILFFFLKVFTKSKWTVALLTTIFAIHPAITATVAWIPGRNESLFAIFTLLSFTWLARYRGNATFGAFLSHSIFFLAALLTKETALVLPILFAIFLATRDDKIRLPGKQIFYLCIIWFVAIVAWFVLSTNAIEQNRSLPLSYIIKTLIERSPALFLYVGKMAFPIFLSTQPIINATGISIGILVFILIALGLLLAHEASRRNILFGSFWVALTLFPTLLSEDPTSIPIFLEYRIYLSLIGFLIIIAEFPLLKNFQRNKTPLLITAIIVIAAYSGTSFIYAKNYKNDLSFWDQAVQSSPNLPKAYVGLGVAKRVRGDLTGAEEAYKNAIALNPNEWFTHNNLGYLYMTMDRHQEAEQMLKKELEIYPKNQMALLNLGRLYYQYLKRPEDARASWEHVIEINPDFLLAHEYLAIYFYEQKRDLKRSTEHVYEVLKRGGSVQPNLYKVVERYETSKSVE